MILERIQSTSSSDTFIYHPSIVWYKPYILSKTKSQHDENVEDNEGDMMVEIDDAPPRKLQTFGTLREKPSSRNNIREIKCVIWGKLTKNNIYDKHRLEVDSRAEKFLKMAKNRLHDLYNRISSCTDVHRLYGSDLYYHSKCMGNYLRKTGSVDNWNDMSNSN